MSYMKCYIIIVINKSHARSLDSEGNDQSAPFE